MRASYGHAEDLRQVHLQDAPKTGAGRFPLRILNTAKETTMNPRDTLNATILVATTLVFSVAATFAQAASPSDRTVEVAYNGQTLFVDAADPSTTKGAHFIVEGIMYRPGTLDNCDHWGDSCGWVVNSEGELEPEFPEAVIGHFSCSGFVMATEGWDEYYGALLAGDFAAVAEWLALLRGQPSVRVTQTYDFNLGAPGHDMVITDGYEVFAFAGDPMPRPITGGSGKFRGASGESILREISRFNASGAASVVVEFPFAVIK